MVVALVWTSPATAGKADDIWKRIQKHLKRGEELEACELALKLKRYKGDEVYKQAEATLLKKGISIKKPLHSYTIKRIIALQNETEAIRAKKGGQAPNPGYRKKYLDGWSQPLGIEIVSRSGYLYLIRSAGPDRRYHTNDDLAVGQRLDARFRVKQKSIKAADPARSRGKQSMYRIGGPSGGLPGGPGSDPLPGASGQESPPPPPGSGAEREVSLDDLLKQ